MFFPTFNFGGATQYSSHCAVFINLQCNVQSPLTLPSPLLSPPPFSAMPTSICINMQRNYPHACMPTLQQKYGYSHPHFYSRPISCSKCASLHECHMVTPYTNYLNIYTILNSSLIQ